MNHVDGCSITNDTEHESVVMIDYTIDDSEKE